MSGNEGMVVSTDIHLLMETIIGGLTVEIS